MKDELSLIEFSLKFGNHDNCVRCLENIRWPTGIIVCPTCGQSGSYRNLDCKTYTCKSVKCKSRFGITVGTIMENTKVPLSKWFFMMYMMVLNQKNINAVEMASYTGVRQKASWSMMMKIRTLFKQKEGLKFSGTVEIDECFVSKSHQWKKMGASSFRKLPVIGMLERNSKRVILKVLPDRKMATIESVVLSHVDTGSTIYTDGHLSYKNLSTWFSHSSVNHSEREYVRGDVHTNGIESAWRVLKSTIRSSHQSVHFKHLQTYCDEIAFKINNRDMKPSDRFRYLLQRAVCGSNNYASITEGRDNSVAIKPQSPISKSKLVFINEDLADSLNWKNFNTESLM